MRPSVDLPHLPHRFGLLLVVDTSLFYFLNLNFGLRVLVSTGPVACCMLFLIVFPRYIGF